jgi:calcineurin-like phosphoesterase
MHTTEIGGVVFHHNGDYSGDVTIAGTFGAHATVEVPFETLERLVAMKKQQALIVFIEGLDLRTSEGRSSLEVIRGAINAIFMER